MSKHRDLSRSERVPLDEEPGPDTVDDLKEETVQHCQTEFLPRERPKDYPECVSCSEVMYSGEECVCVRGFPTDSKSETIRVACPECADEGNLSTRGEVVILAKGTLEHRKTRPSDDIIHPYLFVLDEVEVEDVLMPSESGRGAWFSRSY